MDFAFIEDEAVRAQAVTAYQESLKTAVATAVATQVAEAVSGLKAKNDELLNEKKTIQEKLKLFGDIEDPVKAKEALKFFQESTEAQMIKDGRIDELISMKTAAFRADVEAKVKELENTIQVKGQEATTYKSRFEKKMVEDHLREIALRAGVLPSAIPDVLLRGGTVFSLGASGEVEARDGENKLKQTADGMILTSDKWVAGLKESSPHYWPPSKSGGLGGPGGGDDGDIQAKLADLAAKGDMVGYRKLRDKVKKK